MARQIQTGKDVLQFYAEYQPNNEQLRNAMCNRLKNLHTVYDEAQGYATMILEREDDKHRYLALKYMAGVAIAIAMQDDEVIEDFIKYGSRGSAFWQMMDFEIKLRKKAILNEQDSKRLANRLNPYLKSSVNMVEACNDGSRIGTCLLYPMLAIVHGYHPKGYTNEQFLELIEKFFETNIKMDVKPIFGRLTTKDHLIELRKLAKELEGQLGSNIFSLDITKKISNLKPFENDWTNFDAKSAIERVEEDFALILACKEEKSEVKNEVLDLDNSQDALEEVSEINQEEIKTSQQLIDTPEFFQYALVKFNQCEDFSSVDLGKFSFEITKTIMGRYKKVEEVHPFEGVESADDVRAIFNDLEPILQEIFIQDIFANYAKKELKKDVVNYKSLDADTFVKFKAVCEIDETVKKAVLEREFKELKQERLKEKEKAKDIRRLVRFSKRDDEFYGLN